jgi:hypothetical protein
VGVRRSDAVVVAGWPVLAAGGLWFALQGFTTHGPDQLALEVVGLLLLGVCQARFAPEGWARSPLWSGVFPLAWTAMVLGPSGLTGLVYWIGVVVIAVALVVRLERVRQWGLVAGLVAGLIGALGTRAQVLWRAAGGSEDGRQSSVARSPLHQLSEELVGPLRSGPPSPRVDGPPIVLLTVDTLRADAAVKMRSFQRLASRGASWERAMSTSSWTVPAVASMLTGALPARHGAGVSAGGFQGLSQEVPTLAGTLGEAGYQTVGVVTNAWLTEGLGFSRGFDLYLHADERFHHRLVLAGFPHGPKGHEGEAVVDRALDWLEQAPDGGWFLWVHLIDPHLPYLHVEGSLEQGLSDERLRAGMRLDDEVVARVRAAYQQEVDYADAQLGRLLDALEARGVLDDGAVLMTSDHGEELWDHGATGHGHQHHTEVVDVALALVAPGVPAGARQDLASLVDVGTTLAGVAGLVLGEGSDLRQPVPDDRIAVAQGNAYFRQQRSARGPAQRAIVGSAGDGPLTCFDTVADPAEQHELTCVQGSTVAAAALSAEPPIAGAAATVPREALEALGYVMDDATPTPTPTPTPP